MERKVIMYSCTNKIDHTRYYYNPFSRVILRCFKKHASGAGLLKTIVVSFTPYGTTRVRKKFFKINLLGNVEKTCPLPLSLHVI
jgi:hypothetical protein